MLRLLTAAIRLYQLCVSPYFTPVCRFHPTCSEYGLTALRRHGLGRGLGLTVRRLLRCRPWGPMGYDPVEETHEKGLPHGG